MRKLLLIVFVFTFSLAQAQDLAPLRSMTKMEAASFADSITAESRKELMLWDVHEGKRLLTFEFIEASTDTVALNKVIKSGHHIDVEFYEIDFEIFYEGRDIPLEIEGEKKYRFHQARLKFLDLFPVWKKYFNNEATIEEVRNDYDMKQARYKTKNVDWLYKLEGNNTLYWTINRFY